MVANDIDNKKVTSNMRRENEFIMYPKATQEKVQQERQPDVLLRKTDDVQSET